MAPQAPLGIAQSIPDPPPCGTGVGDSFSATKLSLPCPSLRRKGPASTWLRAPQYPGASQPLPDEQWGGVPCSQKHVGILLLWGSQTQTTGMSQGGHLSPGLEQALSLGETEAVRGQGSADLKPAPSPPCED